MVESNTNTLADECARRGRDWETQQRKGARAVPPASVPAATGASSQQDVTQDEE